MTKILPVGIDDFLMIREQDFYYLNKSKFISTLIHNRGMVNLFTRPRRFGKTLTISMLKAFFEVGGNPELFSGLEIEQEKELCEQYHGKYPVVSISLKGIDGLTFAAAISKLRILISTECKRLKCLVENLRVDNDDEEVFELLRTRKRCRIKAKRLK